MRVRTHGLPIFLIATLFGLGCDGPGFGWPGTDEIDADVVRIQELAAGRVAAGEPAPNSPDDLVAATPAPAVTPPPAAAEPDPEPEPEPDPEPEPEPEPEPDPDPDPQPESESAAPDADRGATAYALYCSSCHGATGQGDGPVGAALQPPPTNHTDGGYMNPLGNDHLFKVVSEGGQAVGKSPMMTPWGAMLAEDQIWDVIAYMRTLAQPAYEGSVP
ncbi:MAG: cytochrome c [bacterium]|nr:cytochrome c [bacterium]